MVSCWDSQAVISQERDDIKANCISFQLLRWYMHISLKGAGEYWGSVGTDHDRQVLVSWHKELDRDIWIVTASETAINPQRRIYAGTENGFGRSKVFTCTQKVGTSVGHLQNMGFSQHALSVACPQAGLLGGYLTLFFANRVFWVTVILSKFCTRPLGPYSLPYSPISSSASSALTVSSKDLGTWSVSTTLYPAYATQPHHSARAGVTRGLALRRCLCWGAFLRRQMPGLLCFLHLPVQISVCQPACKVSQSLELFRLHPPAWYFPPTPLVLTHCIFIILHLAVLACKHLDKIFVFPFTHVGCFTLCVPNMEATLSLLL